MNYEKYLKTIKRDGLCIIKNCISLNDCSKIIKLIENIYKNKKNKNLINIIENQLVIKDLIFRNFKFFLKLIDLKVVIKFLETIFKDDFILDNIIASNSLKSNSKKQKNKIHIDGHLPITKFEHTTDMVVIICLNDFNENNGSTKYWPKSHLSGIRVNDVKKIPKKFNNYKSIKTQAGSIIFLTGQTWHQIGKNISGEKRWAIIIHYKKWWIKPSLNFTLCGKKFFSYLNSYQKKLFGFTSISPKINLKTLQRVNFKTKRKIESVPKKYYKALDY